MICFKKSLGVCFRRLMATILIRNLKGTIKVKTEVNYSTKSLEAPNIFIGNQVSKDHT